MRVYKHNNSQHPARARKRTNWGILTLDDLDKTKGKYNQLIVQLKAKYKAHEKLDDQEVGQTSEDFSI